MREQRTIFDNIDWQLVFLYFALVLFGWMNIYAAVYNEDHKSIFDFSQQYGKQLIWIVTSLVLALIILITDAKFYSAFAYVFFGLVMFSLVAVLVIGNKTSGAQSWFEIGAFKIQPAEFAKFATNLAVAKYLSMQNINIRQFRTKVVVGSFLIFPLLAILLQNDTGSAIVFVCFVFVLYREGLSGSVLLMGVGLAFLFFMALLVEKFVLIGVIAGVSALVYYLVMKKTRKNLIIISAIVVGASGFVYSVDKIFTDVLESHQKDRINVLIGKEVDPKGVGYNVNQSKIAIGSGGFMGKGFLQGTQTKYDFVPEQSTDFIFCTIGEEWGFVGSTIVVFLFLWMMVRIIIISERQRSDFTRIYGYGLASILFFHFTINVGMALGILPVIGIPLPFFSYGGSSLWSFTILFFIFIKLDSYRLNLL
ncbi:MAG: rod shape-determining protein RodA [Bacteroidetes bacterium]|nr:rod shape-determining protein RodA [Bacteroidota bacterium]MBU1718646.1 rod shape-determining protein RodA [Bacteroidota bacterium]